MPDGLLVLRVKKDVDSVMELLGYLMELYSEPVIGGAGEMVFDIRAEGRYYPEFDGVFRFSHLVNPADAQFIGLAQWDIIGFFGQPTEVRVDVTSLANARLLYDGLGWFSPAYDQAVEFVRSHAAEYDSAVMAKVTEWVAVFNATFHLKVVAAQGSLSALDTGSGRAKRVPSGAQIDGLPTRSASEGLHSSPGHDAQLGETERSTETMIGSNSATTEVEQQPTTRTSIPEKRSITEDCLPAASSVKKFYKDYSPATARLLLDALPRASELAEAEERKLTIAFVALKTEHNRNTVSRYFNALIKAGLTTWKDITIPHGEKRVAKTDRPQGS